MPWSQEHAVTDSCYWHFSSFISQIALTTGTHLLQCTAWPRTSQQWSSNQAYNKQAWFLLSSLVSFLKNCLRGFHQQVAKEFCSIGDSQSAMHLVRNFGVKVFITESLWLAKLSQSFSQLSHFTDIKPNLYLPYEPFYPHLFIFRS